MNVALYIADGRKQIVLTPENTFEETALFKGFSDGQIFRTFRGNFYSCAGGYVRYIAGERDSSLILVPTSLNEAKKEVPGETAGS